MALSEGVNQITVTVTAEDGVTAEIYSVTVTRGDRWGRRLPDLDIALDVLDSNAQPSGVWSDGDKIWVIMDWSSGDVRVYSLTDGTERPDLGYRLSGGAGSSLALWSDNATLWVADLQGGVLAYRLSEHDLDAEVLAAAGNTNSPGLWSDGQTIWIMDGLANGLKAYDVTGLR